MVAPLPRTDVSLPRYLHRMQIATSTTYNKSRMDPDFPRIQALVYKHTAIVVSDEKVDFIKARLAKRLRHFGIDTIGEYCDRVESGHEALEAFTSLITTNHTYFFRECHHFEKMISYLKENKDSDRVIWSAGCSTGEEPYSIAISMAESLQPATLSNTRIIATDIDEKVLETARKAVYGEAKLQSMSSARRNLGFRKESSVEPASYRVKHAIRDRIELRKLNLVEPFKFDQCVNLIFCRNVTIYFDRKTKIDLFRKFADIQRSGDLLFVGHSENLNELCRDYVCIGGTTYRRL